ncbi:MAG: nitroreductase family protein [Calditerrivibrio sp.]|nr:nitroreductase family protein [Calditerrivibrio sp.]
MDILSAINSRRSVNYFDPNYEMTDDEIGKILEVANLTPSSMNLQPWKVIVAKSLEIKGKLKEACFNQQKVVEASCNFIIVADPYALEENLEAVLKSWIDLGYLNSELAEKYRSMAFALYQQPESTVRKFFAIKNASFFAMSVMYAALGYGFSTHPMDGFDEKMVKSLFNLPEDIVIPVIIACGKFKEDAKLLPRAFRRDLSEFVKIV